MSSLKRRALAHYDRMIAWAEQQDPDDFKLITTMVNAIGEVWGQGDCSYCSRYYDRERASCGDCPLLSHSGCCGERWSAMHGARTWGAWVTAARAVRAYIEEHG